MRRNANAVWNGPFKEGYGNLTTDSGALSHTMYSCGSRFEDKVGTNPEELIAAALAGCFSMALAAQLEKNHIPAESIESQASISLEKEEGKFVLTNFTVDTSAWVPGASDEQFQIAVRAAKAHCPVSMALGSSRIKIEARLLPEGAQLAS